VIGCVGAGVESLWLLPVNILKLLI
jgi:hypothetical protein